MDIIRLSTRQPITIAVAVLFVFLAGILVWKVVPIQMTPEVEDTIISVMTSWENASPQEIESEVVDPQEEKLQGLSNLRRISSVSSQGQGSIRLEFNPGVDKDGALREVSDKLREVSSYPDNVDQPVVEANDPENQDYIAWYLLESNDDSFDIQTLLDVAEDRIKPQLERISGISEINVLGGREREVQVRFDPEKLAQHHITIGEFITALRKANNNISAGSLKIGKTDVRIRTVGRFSSKEQILDVIIRRDISGVVSVSDVAVVEETFKEYLSFVRSNGKKVLAFNFQKESGSNVLDIMEQLQAKIEALQQPGGILEIEAQKIGLNGTLSMSVAYDSTEYIHQALNLVENNIYIGGSLAIVVLLLFLRSFRPVGIIALSIPVSMIGTVVIMVILGRSINVVSLAGLAFAVGMVVDNCIVVLENIYRHLEMEKSRLQAAYDGTREVAGAVLASTLTTVVVFIPILLITDQIGQLFRDISLSLIISVTISYLVSITLIPSVSTILLQKNGKVKQETEKKPILYRVIYTMNGTWLSRISIIFVFLLTTIVGIMKLTPPMDYLPKGNRNITFGLMIPPPGYSIDQLEAMGKRVERIIRPYWENAPNRPAIPISRNKSGETVLPPALKRYFLVSRGGSLFHGGISTDASRATDIVTLFQAATNQTVLPGTYAFAFQFPLFRIGGSTGSAIKINLTGTNLDQISTSTSALFGALMKQFGPGTLRPDPANFNVQPREMQIIPNNLHLSEMMMTSEDLGQIVQALGDGIPLGDYDLSGDLVDVKVLSRNGLEKNFLESLENVPITTPNGDVVPLGRLGTFIWSNAPEQIKRIGRRRAISLEFTPPEGMPLEEGITSVKTAVNHLRKAGAILPGIEIDIEGTAGKLVDIRRTLFGDGTFFGTISSSFFIAIAAVYLLMCILFQSWSKPFIIMVSVPLATFGGFIGLGILHYWSISDRYMPVQNLDMLTILGFVILTGVVVNNAILIVDQADKLLLNTGQENHFLAIREAIAQAVQNRMRPIFMSMLTSVGGMLPLVLVPGSGAELYRGLGAVVVGGMIVSTVFTLFLIPALLSLFLELSHRFYPTKNAGILVVGFVFIMMTGCKISTPKPDLQISVPPAWHTKMDETFSEEDLAQWWEQFQDPVLTELIQKAIQNNTDMIIGLERIARSRAVVEKEASLRFPRIITGSGYRFSKFTENIKGNFRTLDPISNWDSFIEGSWEVDFFGRIRESIRAAAKDFETAQEDMHALHLILVADLARQYFRYRSFQEQELLLKDTLKLEQENIRLLHAKMKSGTKTVIDINKAKEAVSSTNEILLEQKKHMTQAIYQLCFLVGEIPGSLGELLDEPLFTQIPERPITIGIPADLLRRRPDIRRAEFLIEAQASRLHIARAEYYPKFSLQGNIGFNSTYLKDLLKVSSLNYGFGPSFSWRVFSRRRINHEVEEQEALLRENIANYRKTVLFSLEEVEENIVAFVKEKKRLKERQTSLAIAEESVAISRKLYATGIKDYSAVLQSLLHLLKCQEELILYKEQIMLSLIQLYQALGGGWNHNVSDLALD